MKSIEKIGLKDVQAVYGGPEGDLWELVMGQQIHIGGFVSSMDLAEKAGIKEGMKGVDLCCCNGGGDAVYAKACPRRQNCPGLICRTKEKINDKI
jgi:hypothetical protein